ncbi:MAG: hypothetical protein AAF483_08020 [Planctomycetota bacterium]
MEPQLHVSLGPSSSDTDAQPSELRTTASIPELGSSDEVVNSYYLTPDWDSTSTPYFPASCSNSIAVFPPKKRSWLQRLDDHFSSTRPEGGRWFLAEYDFDNRGYNVLHFMGNSPLPLGFSLWGFVDLEGAEGTTAEREDISRHFLELDIKRRLWRNTGIIAELNDLQGADNEIGRLGAFWTPETDALSPSSGLWAGQFRLGLKFFPIQTISRTGQWSFNWNKQFASIAAGRVSAGGFFDLNYDTSSSNVTIVTEHQIRLRVAEGLHLITEFRLNEYLIDEFGIAPGVQYRF